MKQKKGVPVDRDALFCVSNYSALLSARSLRVRNFLASEGSLSCGIFPCS